MELQKKAYHQKWMVLVWIGLFGCTVPSAMAQDSLRGEKGFYAARKLVFQGHRREARGILYHVLNADDDYPDAQILLARTYAWDDRYDSARYILNKVNLSHPSNKEAIDALIDVELWSDHPEKALEMANRGLKIDPVYEDFMLKKVRALNKTGDMERAWHTADSFATATGNAAITRESRTLKRALYKNKITFSSDVDIFSSTFSPWYYEALSYGRKTKLLGTVIGRFNYAHRFDTDGYQGEVDAYPSITKKMYAFVNAGLSGSDIFPKARYGLSLYYNLPRAFEAELGARYLVFSGSSAMIYTGSASKYYKNFWFSVRSFIIPGATGISQSYFLLSRYYFGNADNYMTLTLGSGVSPDERAKDVIFFGPQENLLSSRKIKLDGQWQVIPDYYLSLRAAFSHDEIRASTFRENPSFGLSLEKRF